MWSKIKTYLKNPKIYRPALALFGIYLVFLYIIGVLLNLTLTTDTSDVSYGVISSYKVLFEKDFFGITTVLFVMLVGVALLYNIRKKDLAHEGKKDERGFKYSKLGVEGTSHFMEEQEAVDVYTGTSVKGLTEESGFVLGQLKDSKQVLLLPWNIDNINHNILLIGSPGTGKTATFIANQILQTFAEFLQGNPTSALVIDTKGDLYSKYAGLARHIGFKTRIVNFVEFEHSDGFQPLSIVYDYEKKMVDESMVTMFAQTVVTNTAGEKAGDVYFENLCMNLLESVILIEFYKFEDGLQDMPTFPSVLERINILASPNERKNYTDIAEGYRRTRGRGNPATRKWNLFISEEKQVANTILTVSTRLSTVQVDTVAKMLSHDDIDFLDLGTEPSIFFLRISDQFSTYEFLSSLFLNFLFIKLSRFADSQPNKYLPIRVKCLLDEFCNVGVITDVKKQFSTLRSRHIDLVPAIQNIPQLYETYGEDCAKEIIGDCSVKIVLGADDPDTKEWVSKETGTATVIDEGKRTEFGSLDSAMMTLGTKKRELMTPDEVGRMDMQEELIFFSHQPVLKAKKFFYKNHPLAHLLEQNEYSENFIDHIPHYQQYGNNDSYNKNNQNKNSYSEGKNSGYDFMNKANNKSYSGYNDTQNSSQGENYGESDSNKSSSPLINTFKF